MSNETRVAIVTVHGTGDTAPNRADAGEKWFQQTSSFTEQVKARLAVRGFAADILPLHWSGANSAMAREQAADALADTVKRLHGRYGPQVHVIAHSHGGNVASDAAAWLRWGTRPGKERIASLTTVGTPFFKAHTGAAERYAGFAFLGLSIVSALAFLFTAVLLGLVAASEGMGALELGWGPLFGISATIIVALFFMLRLSLQGYRRLTKPTTLSEAAEAVHAVWHRNDEAIAFLQKVEAMGIRPFPRGAWFRQSRRAGIAWGVRAVIVAGVVAALLLVPGLTGPEGGRLLNGMLAAVDMQEEPGIASFMLFAFAPVIFVSVYLLYRFFFGLLPDFLLRPAANASVEAALKGMAFGRDGDETLSQVATRSHALATREVVLEGPLAERLQANASGAAAALIEKYRWSLFTVGSDTNAALSDLATDAMTWDSLIHTTYFDHQETAELIADHIAVKAASRL